MKSTRRKSGRKRPSGKKSPEKNNPENSNGKPESEGSLKLDDNNVLCLDSFPRFNQKQNGSLRKISDYLKRLISRSFRHTRISAVDLPSMNRLCGFFGCSQGELLNVLLLLKGQGLDYKVSALDKPISFWRNTVQAKRSLKTS